MPKIIRWGILSTGAISNKVTTAFKDVPDMELRAVGSRTLEAANTFGDKFDIPNRHGSYEALVADPDVEAIYIATPHPFHAENSLLCLNAGKAVLCEKPFMINANEAAGVIATAREQQLFLMEAMWVRFLPQMTKLRELLADDIIGDLVMLQADIGFNAAFNPSSRLYDPALGGGALLDIGVYVVSLAHMLFGTPESVSAVCQKAPTNVDSSNAMLFQHAEGRMSLLASTICMNGPRSTVITGTKGNIRLLGWNSGQLSVQVNGEAEQIIEVETPLNGHGYQALEVNRCLREGLLESEIMPLDETLAIMETMDQVRAQWGLKYPME